MTAALVIAAVLAAFTMLAVAVGLLSLARARDTEPHPRPSSTPRTQLGGPMNETPMFAAIAALFAQAEAEAAIHGPAVVAEAEGYVREAAS